MSVSKKRPKPSHINVLPSLKGNQSLLMALPIRDETGREIHINFSMLREVDSYGVGIFICRLSNIIEKNSITIFRCLPPKNEHVKSVFEELGIEAIIHKIGNNNMSSKIDLFTDIVAHTDIIRFNQEKYDSAETFDLFETKELDREKIIFTLLTRLGKMLTHAQLAKISRETIVKILSELCKNTLDHAAARYFFIISSLKFNLDNTVKSFDFFYMDDGVGITHSVRNYLGPLSDNRIGEKGSAIDFLHRAFTNGFTTKPTSGLNFGRGLTLICDLARGANFKTGFYDAQSYIDLFSFDVLTHSKMRSCSTALVFHPPLIFEFYFDHV